MLLCCHGSKSCCVNHSVNMFVAVSPVNQFFLLGAPKAFCCCNSSLKLV